MEYYSIIMYNRSLTTTNMSKLNALYTNLPAGAPITSAQLAKLGISADLAVHYARSGWLQRLARGVFCKPGEKLRLHPTLLVLERQIEGLHVGGKTALDWYGVRHNVAQQPVLKLYGWVSARLPEWFTNSFPAEYHRKRLFDESPGAMLAVTPFDHHAGAPMVSTPNRAFLELLDEVGVRQPLQEARDIAEGAHALNAEVLSELLGRCTSVKTVRLCLSLGRELSLPWIDKLDASALRKGSDRPWISKSGDGLLVLK